MSILEEDINVISDEIYSLGLRDCSFLVTGASGLIGSLIVKSLAACGKYGIGITVYAHGRDPEKLQRTVGPESASLHFLAGNIEDGLPADGIHVDYIFHCASPTASDFFCSSPVETMEAICSGTRSVMEYCLRSGGVKKVVYLSSCEVYGQFSEKIKITEDCQGYVNPLDVRSSYPIGKRMAECLCRSYWQEYGVPVSVGRLTQTFGAGIPAGDNRVFAQFSRNLIKGTDIVLHTKGESEKPYVYTSDAIRGLFHILLKGECGEAYNIANENTCCSIMEMARLVSSLGSRPVDVVVGTCAGAGKYAPPTHLDMDCTRLRKLGWEPKYGLREMYLRTLEYLKGNQP